MWRQFQDFLIKNNEELMDKTKYEKRRERMINGKYKLIDIRGFSSVKEVNFCRNLAYLIAVIFYESSYFIPSNLYVSFYFFIVISFIRLR